MTAIEIDREQQGALKETDSVSDPGAFIEHHVRPFRPLIPDDLTALLAQDPPCATHAEYRQSQPGLNRTVNVSLGLNRACLTIDITSKGMRALITGLLTPDGWSLAQAEFFENSGRPVADLYKGEALNRAEAEFGITDAA